MGWMLEDTKQRVGSMAYSLDLVSFGYVMLQ